MIRLVPKNPRPQINYEEWDGLLRVAFARKNKTLRASFLGRSSVLAMLEANYRTWCAQNDIPIEDGPMEATLDSDMLDQQDDDDDDDDMQVDEDEDVPDFFKEEPNTRVQDALKGNSGRKRKGKVSELVREKVRHILEYETKLADKRARMCDEGDFLKLLLAFNQKGFHFS